MNPCVCYQQKGIEDNKFCHICGRRLIDKVPLYTENKKESLQSELIKKTSQVAATAESIEIPLMKYCVCCQLQRIEDDRFCHECGRRLIDKVPLNTENKGVSIQNEISKTTSQFDATAESIELHLSYSTDYEVPTDISDMEVNWEHKPIAICWETTKYHITLLISLIGFILFYSKPWIVMKSLEALVIAVAAEAVGGATGVTFIVNIFFAVPMGLAVIAIVLVLTKRKVKAFAIISGIVISFYWLGLYLMYSIGKIASVVGIKYSFTATFYLSFLAAIVIFIVGIILPVKNLNQSKGYIVFRKQIGRNYYNLGVKISNIILLILLLFTPFVKYNPALMKAVGKADLLNQFLIDHTKTDLGISDFISTLGNIMFFANIILKFVPVILIIVYLVKNWYPKGSLKLNKSATIYILIVFGILWFLLRSVDKIVIISNSLYFAVIISLGLIIANIIMSDSFKAFAGKTKQATAFAKQKSIDTAAIIKQKSVDTIAVLRQKSAGTGANVKQKAVELANIIRNKSNDAKPNVKRKDV